MPGNEDIVVSVIRFAVELFILGGGAVLYLSKMKADIVKAITDHEKVDEETFAIVRREVSAARAEAIQQDMEVERAFGDTARALREKVHTLELEMLSQQKNNLEMFIRRDSFFHSFNGLQDSFRAAESKAESREEKAGMYREALLAKMGELAQQIALLSPARVSQSRRGGGPE